MSRPRALFVVLLAGCGSTRAELPYDVSRVSPAPVPTHPLSVALVRLKDGRLPSEAPDGDRYRYRGIEYRGTVLEQLGLEPLRDVTWAVAAHLARARVFEKVLVVAEPAQVEADLIVEGRLIRLRGYVEVPQDQAPELRVVGESAFVFVVRRSPGTPVIARFEVGFSFHDLRAAESAPEPWALAAEVLRPALEQLVRGARRAELRGAPLLGPARLPASIALPETEPALRGALAAGAPKGWTFEDRASAWPRGWKKVTSPPAVECASAAFRARQEHGFHRMLGPFVPEVRIWWCPDTAGLEWDPHEDFPARYLGRDPAGRRWFARQVGRSSWRRAPESLAEALGLVPPALRHAFRLGPGAVETGPSPTQSRKVQDVLQGPRSGPTTAPRGPLRPLREAPDANRSEKSEPVPQPPR